MSPVGHTYGSLACDAPMPDGNEPNPDDHLPEDVLLCQHEPCTILDRRVDEPDVLVVLAQCDDCPAKVSWRQTPGRSGERLGLQVEDVQDGDAR